jgi:hypothetical protein
MVAPALEAMLVPRSTGSKNSVLTRFYYHLGRGPRSSDVRLWDDPSHNRTARIRADYGTADVTARRYGGFGEKSRKKRAVVVARMTTRGARQSDTAVGPTGICRSSDMTITATPALMIAGSVSTRRNRSSRVIEHT